MLNDVIVEWTSDIVIHNDNAFGNVDVSSATLHVPAGTKALYEAADVWKDFGTIVETTITQHDFDENADPKAQLDELMSEGKRVDITLISAMINVFTWLCKENGGRRLIIYHKCKAGVLPVSHSRSSMI